MIDDVKCVLPFMNTGGGEPECSEYSIAMEAMDRYRQWTDPGKLKLHSRHLKLGIELKLFLSSLSGKVSQPVHAVVHDQAVHGAGGQAGPDVGQL